MNGYMKKTLPVSYPGSIVYHSTEESILCHSTKNIEVEKQSSFARFFSFPLPALEETSFVIIFLMKELLNLWFY